MRALARHRVACRATFALPFRRGVESWETWSSRRSWSTNPSSPPADVPVVIVGGGPVGLTLSILLSRLGVDSQLVERRAAPTAHPQAHFVNNRTREIFRPMLGLDREVARAQPPLEDWRHFIYATRMLGGVELGRVDHFDTRDIRNEASNEAGEARRDFEVSPRLTGFVGGFVSDVSGVEVVHAAEFDAAQHARGVDEVPPVLQRGLRARHLAVETEHRAEYLPRAVVHEVRLGMRGGRGSTLDQLRVHAQTGQQDGQRQTHWTAADDHHGDVRGGRRRVGRPRSPRRPRLPALDATTERQRERRSTRDAVPRERAHRPRQASFLTPPPRDAASPRGSFYGSRRERCRPRVSR